MSSLLFLTGCTYHSLNNDHSSSASTIELSNPYADYGLERFSMKNLPIQMIGHWMLGAKNSKQILNTSTWTCANDRRHAMSIFNQFVTQDNIGLFDSYWYALLNLSNLPEADKDPSLRRAYNPLYLLNDWKGDGYYGFVADRIHSNYFRYFTVLDCHFIKPSTNRTLVSDLDRFTIYLGQTGLAYRNSEGMIKLLKFIYGEGTFWLDLPWNGIADHKLHKMTITENKTLLTANFKVVLYGGYRGNFSSEPEYALFDVNYYMNKDNGHINKSVSRISRFTPSIDAALSWPLTVED